MVNTGHLVRSSFTGMVDLLGINRMYRRSTERSLTVLYYHGVCDDDFVTSRDFVSRHVPVSIFERHLKFMSDCGYRFVTLSEAVSLLKERKPLPPRTATITFDDGFMNVVRHAYPAMERCGAKGCVYVIPDLVDAGNMVWTDWVEVWLMSAEGPSVTLDCEGRVLEFPLGSDAQRHAAAEGVKRALRRIDDAERRQILSALVRENSVETPDEFKLADWESLRSLDASILEIGSHTATHPNLAQVSDSQTLENEIGGSKHSIEAKLGRPVKHFCYPAGSYDDRVLAEVQRHGYESATSTRFGFADPGDDLFQLRRVDSAGTLSELKSKVSGTFSLYVRLRGGRKKS